MLRSAGRLPRVIAVSLGTNDDPRNTSAFRAAIRDMMAVVGPKRCVVWATVKRPPVAGATYGEYNRILREEAKRTAEPRGRALGAARRAEPAVVRRRRRASRRDRLPRARRGVRREDPPLPLR